jgi:ethanolamine utilization protein EutN
MQICKVKGTVVSTNKSPKLTGMKLMVVTPMDMASGKETGTPLIAVDTVGAGTGEVVMTVGGSSARQTQATEGKPVDAAIIGIVDTIEMNGAMVFRKNA